MNFPFPTAIARFAGRRGRIKPLDLGILIGIVAVIVIVSLPRLSAFARRENEADALRLVQRLTQMFDDESLRAAPPANTQALFDRLPRASRRLFEDQSAVDGGRVLLRHGYFFEFVRVPTYEGDPEGLLAVRAWPERASGPGAPAFLAFSSAAVLRHPTLTPPPVGLDSPPPVTSFHPSELRAAGWQPVNPAGAPR